jgi:hypothetical protein
MSGVKELSVPERAAVALGTAEHEKALIELSKKYADIVEIKNPAGREQAHSAYMTLKNARIAIEKAGKDARDDAVKFGKAVIAEEKRLIEITQAEEARLQKLRDAWDAEVEVERQRKATADKARIDGIRAKIDEIKDCVVVGMGRSSDELESAISELESTEITLEEYFEFSGEAQAAQAATVVKLKGMLVAQLAHEVEQARLTAEREALERQRAELAEQERLAAAARAEQETKDRAERERVEAEQRAAQAKAEEAMRRQQAEHEARMAAEREAANAAWLAQHEAEQASLRAQQEAADKLAAAMSEIQGIQQQVIIAQSGRLGVRKGGTIECLRETLAETEAWEIDPERFGILAGSAESAKTTAVAEIRRLLAEAEAKEREDAEARRQREEAEATARRQEAEAAQAAADKTAREQAERDAAEREALRRVRVQFEKNGPGDVEIVKTLADHYDVTVGDVMGWMKKFDYTAADEQLAAENVAANHMEKAA